MPDTRTDFDWSRYADATLAGLSVLVPIPFVDDAFEAFFRKRIPGAVARSRGRTISGDVRAALEEEDAARGGGCAALPLRLVIGLFKRLSRKLLYFLTVKQATDRLSYYWYRAFLLDHMLAAGHLDNPDQARVAHGAMEEVLARTGGPLPQVARQVVTQMRHVWPALRRARRGEEAEEVRQTRTQLEGRWGEIAQHLDALAARYDQAYAKQGT
ncbi:hypothetical protein [Longimicrobium sp.]|uniref:hypothetical protein n=1 Tax=Longimicrobium sp. TaxID=2029185 RepID=UPI002E32404C|nr:hypothetical protein [Longimicrobium sp.]HEX6038427.1 hypothetical protein [Longimicrobium sp.]